LDVLYPAHLFFKAERTQGDYVSDRVLVTYENIEVERECYVKLMRNSVLVLLV